MQGSSLAGVGPKSPPLLTGRGFPWLVLNTHGGNPTPDSYTGQGGGLSTRARGLDRVSDAGNIE